MQQDKDYKKFQKRHTHQSNPSRYANFCDGHGLLYNYSYLQMHRIAIHVTMTTNT